jgi:A-factor type gamma-butyrolactone 1'-reductase (1S-forming)
MVSFSGKVALVTGATSGIGQAVATALAKAGARVVVAGRRCDLGRAVAEEIGTVGGDAQFIESDVRSTESVSRLVKRTLAHYGALDLAFNNAGISGDSLKSLADHTEESWDAVLDTNLKGIWRCMQHEIPAMLQRGGGAIVNNSSQFGLAGSDLGISPYVASKHGVVGLTRCAAIEYARHGIRVNAICPSLTRTAMLAPAFEYGEEALNAYVSAHVPLGRIANAQEIAAAVLWLLSGEASFVTGQSVAIDGGALAQ